MACNLERPTATELFDRYKNLFQNTVMGGATIIPESNEWYAVAVNYAAAEEFYAITDQAHKERDPRTACCDNLVAMAATDGIYPRNATPAQGYMKLTGTAGTVLTTPLAFTVEETEYVTAFDAGQPTEIDAAGAAVIRVRAVVPGSVGNITATTGTLNTVIAGVETTAEVCGGSFCNGSDVEACETFRQRYMRRLKYQPRATQSWILDKMLEWPCSTRALVRAGTCCQCGCETETAATGSANGGCEECGCKDCGGAMNFYLMFDGSFTDGIAPESVIKEAETWLFGTVQGFGDGQVEMGICGRIVPVTAVKVDVYVDLENCPTSAELSKAQAIVTEYFTTVEPSKSISSSTLETSIDRILGADVAAQVRFELTNVEDGYGDAGCSSGCDGKVYVTACALEPDCDYMLSLNEVTLTNTSNTQGGCP